MEHDEDLIRLLDEHIPGGDYEAETAAFPAADRGLSGPVRAHAAGGFLGRLSSGGMGSAMAFAKSRPRVYTGNAQRVTFEDVAGHDEVVTELKEIVEFLQTPEKYRSLGGRVPKGVLLIGSPGTGKTLLAPRWPARRGCRSSPSPGSDFVELFVGVGASRVSSLFAPRPGQGALPDLHRRAGRDRQGRGAGAGGHDERDQTLNQLLVEMDGFDANRGIILLAATNRPETLDQALVRPGRFDRQVVVDRPDLTAASRFSRSTRGPSRSKRPSTSARSRRSRRVRRGRPGEPRQRGGPAGRPPRQDYRRRLPEFEEGIERLIAGPEKRQRVLRREEKQRIAFHEAGHALVARTCPRPIRFTRSRSSAAATGLGYTLYRPEEDRLLHTRTSLENAVCSLLGGTLAEELVLGEASDGCSSDLQRATQIARRMVVEFGMSPVLGRLNYLKEPAWASPPRRNSPGANRPPVRSISRVRRIIDEAQAEGPDHPARPSTTTLDVIASRLIDQETIDAAELKAILENGECPPVAPPKGWPGRSRDSTPGVFRSRSRSGRLFWTLCSTHRVRKRE